MTAMQSSCGARSRADDVLDFGLALVTARRRLKGALAELTSDDENARMLLAVTLREAWRSRDDLAGGDVENSLMRILKGSLLH